MTARSRAPSPGLDRDGFELEADLIRVLAHPKRLMIVDLLGRGPNTVSEIAERLEMSLQNTSQHLRVMRDRGVVRAQRTGRAVYYALVSPVLAESCQLVRGALLAEMRMRSAHFDVRRETTARVPASRGSELGRARRPIPVPS